MRNACRCWLSTLLLVLLLGVAAAAQSGAQQGTRKSRTEPMGDECARTGECAAIFRGRAMVASQLDNNLKCVDLSDLDGDLPLDVVRSTEILRRTEPWENDSLGYPTVVRNDQGKHPDGRYYLYYAHHDLGSGIGCAVAESIEGP